MFWGETGTLSKLAYVDVPYYATSRITQALETNVQVDFVDNEGESKHRPSGCVYLRPPPCFGENRLGDSSTILAMEDIVLRVIRHSIVAATKKTLATHIPMKSPCLLVFRTCVPRLINSDTLTEAASIAKPCCPRSFARRWLCLLWR